MCIVLAPITFGVSAFDEPLLHPFNGVSLAKAYELVNTLRPDIERGSFNTNLPRFVSVDASSKTLDFR
jgi:hypothetical protein